jgi:hypothetical protein
MPASTGETPATPDTVARRPDNPNRRTHLVLGAVLIGFALAAGAFLSRETVTKLRARNWTAARAQITGAKRRWAGRGYLWVRVFEW